jgi:hypothetical protein
MRVAELTDHDLDVFTDIATNAYPGIKICNDEDKQRTTIFTICRSIDSERIGIKGVRD